MSEIEVVRSDKISYPHGFSTRTGGVSEGEFESLNLGMNRGDDPDRVKENYRRFFDACGIETEEFVCGRQVHGNNVMIVGKENAAKPYGYDDLYEADGYVTAEPGVPLAVFTADCIPLLMTDEDAGVVAAIHCGWRSTVSDIEGNAVEKMMSLGATHENIRACIGPAIGKCCFEVGREVVDAATTLLGQDDPHLYTAKDNGKYMLDLKSVLRKRLIQVGIPDGNIDTISDCTMCMPHKYWSHRYTGGIRGSQAAVICVPVRSQGNLP